MPTRTIAFKPWPPRAMWVRRHVAPRLALVGCVVISLYLGSCMGMSTTDQQIWVIVLICAAVSSIAGFAFSALAGAMLFHIARDPVYIIQIMLEASIALQTYSVLEAGGTSGGVQSEQRGR